MPYIYGPNSTIEVAYYGVQATPEPDPLEITSAGQWFDEVVRRDQVDNLLSRLIDICYACENDAAALVLVLAKDQIGKTTSSVELVALVKRALGSAQKP